VDTRSKRKAISNMKEEYTYNSYSFEQGKGKRYGVSKKRRVKNKWYLEFIWLIKEIWKK
jgi:hypothetical protein